MDIPKREGVLVYGGPQVFTWVEQKIIKANPYKVTDDLLVCGLLLHQESNP
jgi:hypothetical protein